MDALYSTAELAARLRVADSTVRHWRRTGYGPKYFKIGNKARYPHAEVERWLLTKIIGGT